MQFRKHYLIAGVEFLSFIRVEVFCENDFVEIMESNGTNSVFKEYVPQGWAECIALVHHIAERHVS